MTNITDMFILGSGNLGKTEVTIPSCYRNAEVTCSQCGNVEKAINLVIKETFLDYRDVRAVIYTCGKCHNEEFDELFL
jgi:ribosomal protein S27AE